MLSGLLLFILLAVPLPAQAALGISNVEPQVVSSASSANLVVSGTDFQEGAVVSLSNYGPLNTSFVSETTLNAAFPAGITPGDYSLSVANPDGNSVLLPDALTVEQQTSTDTPPDQGEATPTPYVRPLIVVNSYSAGSDAITPGQDFTLEVKIENVGGREAQNLVATFTPGDCVPRQSGGVLAKVELQPGESKRLNQPLTATRELYGKSVATVVMQLSYNDLNGTAYTSSFNLTVPVKGGGGVYATATPTPTGTSVPRAQIVITSYTVNVDPLKPGTNFLLDIQAQNVGSGTAKGLTMILGGGSSSSGAPQGTQEPGGSPGGVSGGSGEFGNFAPVASSNVQYLGDVSAGSSLAAKASLIVNSKTEPGAYPMKISFTFVGQNGIAYTDDQVITLLVYSPPAVEVNFYRDPGAIFAGQPNQLPLQVVNLGRKAVVLGTMKVTGEGGEFSQNSTLVGNLDVGGYFTLDAMLIPQQPGSMDLLVTIDYTDDFNVPQVITKTLQVEVQEMSAPMQGTPMPGTVDGMQPGKVPPGGEMGVVQPAAPETFIQKVWRLVRGLIGLDSAQPTPAPGEIQPGAVPGEIPPDVKPVPVPGPKG
jgi:hypothetical protein